MEKVINIEKLSSDFDDTSDTKKKCEITIDDEGSTKTVICDLNDIKMKEYIEEYSNYLKELLELKKEEVNESRKQKNMKASICYAVGVVGIFGAVLASSKTLVPFFLAAAALGLIPALVINIGYFKPFESSKEALDINNKLQDLETLLQESKEKTLNENKHDYYAAIEKEAELELAKELKKKDENQDTLTEPAPKEEVEHLKVKEPVNVVTFDKSNNKDTYQKVSWQAKKDRFENMRAQHRKKNN